MSFLRLVSILLFFFLLRPLLADFEVENKFASHFCELEAHVEFAKSCFDQGQELEAFFILERAKNSLFDAKHFLIAFDHQFHHKPLKEFTEEGLQSLLNFPDDPQNEIAKWESVLQYHLLKENFKDAKQVLSVLCGKHPDIYRYALQSDQVEGLITGQPGRHHRDFFLSAIQIPLKHPFMPIRIWKMTLFPNSKKRRPLLKNFRNVLKLWPGSLENLQKKETWVRRNLCF